MYNNFFGLKEKPFKLVPNPVYLFLSKSHEEALAHLTYAVSQGDGFVEITGEVGTGKTTLCRAFLENLDEAVDAAYIFNPKLDSVQLLQAINDEFGIDSSPQTVKELLDVLNAFLITRKAAGKKVLLLVDEAQNLGKDVLEQLRLLSNLETTRDKLLQIVLVGQPELAAMLDSHELRQLGQRITLSCRLTPLTFTETQEYILHRIAVASLRPGLKFDSAAIRRMHKFAAGVPRLINIVADRALLIGYGCNSHIITEDIVKTAIGELAGAGGRGLVSRRLPARVLVGLSLVAVGLLAAGFFFRGGVLPMAQVAVEATPGNPSTSGPPVPAVLPETASVSSDQALVVSAGAGESSSGPTAEIETQASELAPVSKAKAEPVPTPVTTLPAMNLGDFLTSIEYRSSRRLALQSALEAWDPSLAVRPELDDLIDDQTFFRLASEQNGLMMQRITGFEFIRSLGVPAVFELWVPGAAQPRYLAVRKMTADTFTLRAGDKDIDVGEAQIRSYWTGMAYLPWKNFLHIVGTIPRNAPDESVLSFKMLLRDIGCTDIDMTSEYDLKSQAVVMDLQRKYGVEADGMVGPLTKIILYREANQYQMPQIFSLERQVTEDAS